jgi:hypothetical protein
MKRLKLASTLCLTLCLAISVILASCSTGGRDATAQHGVAAKLISPHLPFGNPSDAGASPNKE